MFVTVRVRYLFFAAFAILAFQAATIPIAVSLAHHSPSQQLVNTQGVNTDLENAFTYQGRLVLNGVAQDGDFDFEFALFDVESGGSALVTLPAVSAVPVLGGLFTIALDFGPGAFAGSQRWLEVRTRADVQASFEVVGRQEITATPYALFAKAVGPHQHVNEAWTGDLPRQSAGTFSTGLLKVTNTAQATEFTQVGGIGIEGVSKGVGGIGVASVLDQNDVSAVGIDFNSTFGAVVGIDRTAICKIACTGVLGSAPFSMQGFARSYGVQGFGGTAGMRASSGNIGIDAHGINGPGVNGLSENGDGVLGTTNSQFGRGVVGVATRNGADGVGVAGYSGEFAGLIFSPNLTGVYGYAAVQNATGVYGRAATLDAAGVRGFAESANAWAARFTGKVEVAGVFTNPSDLRLKHTVAPLEYGLDKVLDLSPVSYVLNGDESEQERYGLIAQDVERVLPALVLSDGEGMLSLNYMDLIPVLINAIHEQQAQIEALRKEIRVN